MRKTAIFTALSALLLAAPATAQEPTFDAKFLTPETALKAANAAMMHCRDQGYQVAVAIVDRGGVDQIMLRDRYAGAHTPSTAMGKAWTALSFRSSTTNMMNLLKEGTLPTAIGNLDRVVMAGGGMLIEAEGTVVGAIGVSGAPGAEADDNCAMAGIEAIADDLF